MNLVFSCVSVWCLDFRVGLCVDFSYLVFLVFGIEFECKKKKTVKIIIEVKKRTKIYMRAIYFRFDCIYLECCKETVVHFIRYKNIILIESTTTHDDTNEAWWLLFTLVVCVCVSVLFTFSFFSSLIHHHLNDDALFVWITFFQYVLCELRVCFSMCVERFFICYCCCCNLHDTHSLVPQQ